MPVIGKKTYTIPILARSRDFADAETVDNFAFSAEAGPSQDKMYFAKNGIITQVVLLSHSEGVASSNEAWPWYLRINATTDYLLATVSSTAALKNFSKLSGLNIPVTTTDFWNIKTVCPTWATNPTGTWMSGYIVVSY